MIASSFAGEPIAIVRPEQGDVYALEDRCAHRQVPLSKGTVKDCRVHCCYHGWSYDASGRCVDVPYLGKGKLPNGVRTYPACECDGVIFIWPGSSPAAPQPASLGAAADSGYKTRRFGRVVNCHYTFMHENLMDMNHQFLHRRTTGKVSPRYLGKRAGEGWMELDYTFARPDARQPLGESLIMGSFRLDTSVPRDRMTIRTEYPHQTLRFWTSGEEPVLHVWLGYTPVDAEQRKNRSFIILSVRRPKIPGVLNLAWPFWPGSGIAYSRKTGKSSRWSRPPTTRRELTGIRKCSRRYGICANYFPAAVASCPRGRSDRSFTAQGGSRGRLCYCAGTVIGLPLSTICTVKSLSGLSPTTL